MDFVHKTFDFCNWFSLILFAYSFVAGTRERSVIRFNISICLNTVLPWIRLHRTEIELKAGLLVFYEFQFRKSSRCTRSPVRPYKTWKLFKETQTHQMHRKRNKQREVGEVFVLKVSGRRRAQKRVAAIAAAASTNYQVLVESARQ